MSQPSGDQQQPVCIFSWSCLHLSLLAGPLYPSRMRDCPPITKPFRYPVDAVENAGCAFSKDLVGAVCASTGPAASTGAAPRRGLLLVTIFGSAASSGAPAGPCATRARGGHAPRRGRPSSPSRGEL